MRVVAPVLGAGLASLLLFASIDRSQPWTIVSATLAMALLGAVLVRTLSEILTLQRQVSLHARKLSTVSDVVSALNEFSSLGSSLGLALDRLLPLVQADGAVIWLAAAGEARELSAIESRGLPERGVHPELLAAVRGALGTNSQAFARHSAEIAGAGRSGVARCLSYRLGGNGEEYGYITLFRWEGEFHEIDTAVLGAVGSNITGSLRSVRMIREARRLADRDPVTGLHNHRSAYQRLHTEVDRHAVSGQAFALLMMDLDNFKLFNDTYGHPAGDEVLKRVAAVLRRACRDTDLVARYGGDEFCVILPETTLKQAIRCAERIQASLGKERFRCQDSAPLPIGFSYGISVYPQDSTDALELVSVADANMYRSKAQGGNRITAGAATSIDGSLVYVKGFDLFRAMVTAIDNKDGYTRKHSEEVTQYSLQIARALGLGEEMLQTIQLAGMLHDIGKIGVPDAILRKPGPLTPEEFAVMAQHPIFGALIVGALPGMEQVVMGVRHHHERYDGTGYPDRLRGEEIPLVGRIMAVADAYSAMTAARPYRKALTERRALAEVLAGLGTQFDPEIGKLFVELRSAEVDRRRSTPRTRRPKREAPPLRESAETPAAVA